MRKFRTHYLWRLRLGLLLLVTLLLIGCGSERQIVGKWRKTSTALCGAVYPAMVEFFDDGEYVGALPNWSGGSYRVVDGRRLRLDTSMGPGTYEFKISDDVLTFKNDWGCTFKYTKEY